MSRAERVAYLLLAGWATACLAKIASVADLWARSNVVTVPSGETVRFERGTS